MSMDGDWPVHWWTVAVMMPGLRVADVGVKRPLVTEGVGHQSGAVAVELIGRLAEQHGAGGDSPSGNL